MSEHGKNTKRSRIKLTAEEQFEMIKPYLDQGWSMTMALSKAGLSQYRLGNPLFNHPEYIRISKERRKRRPTYT